MTSAEIQQTISDLQGIYTAFTPTQQEPEITMFGLVSRYNVTGKNTYFIGGDWVIANCPAPLNTLK